jgi:phage tail protein X
MIYRTKQGDVLDDVVFRYYGDTDNGIVELVLSSNEGLADLGPVLPSGVEITLPDRPVKAKKTLQKLWD